VRRIVLLIILVAVLGLIVGYLIFAKTAGGYVSVRTLISPSQNVFDELVKQVTGIDKIRRNILLSGAVGAGIGLLLGLAAARGRR
jgi:hypothetical protein